MAENEISVVKLSDRQNHMRTGKGLKLVRDLCAQLVDDADSFHGSIWPGNITLDSSKKWILGSGSDVPVAQRTADEVEYLAPEYFWDGAKSAAADVYSLGLFLYAAYNRGRMPFQAKNKTLTDKDRSTALRRRMKGEVISVTGSISAELKAIITKALSYDPEKRFISAAELLAALNEVPEALSAGEESAAADAPAIPMSAAEATPESVSEDVSAVDEITESFPREETSPAESVVEEAPAEEVLQENPSAEEPVTEELADEEIPQETLTETPDAAVSVPEEDILTETPDAEAEPAPEEENASAPFSADAKKYTVRKDYEENLVSSRSSASSRRRRKRVSPLIPILCILAAGILLVVILVLALHSVDNSEENLPVKPSEPYTINASELENKEEPSASTAVSETEDTQETTPAAEEEEEPSAQSGSESIDGKIVDPAEGTVYVAESGSKLRTGPSTSYDVADSLARGTALELTGTVGDDWSQVKYNGEEYYISNSLISETDPTGKAQAEEAKPSETASASGDGIGTLEIIQEANVRSGPGTNYDKVGVAKVGSEYTILDVTSDSKWYKIDFGGKTGYINRNMVSVIEMDYSATATVISDVNIRSGPGSGYDKMGVAKAGETLTVVGTSNGWYKISYDGKTGYVAGNFVTIR